MEDKTFIFHSAWLAQLQHLSVEKQDAAIADIVRYASEYPLEHEDMDSIMTAVEFVKGSIDFSKDKYAQKVQGGISKKGKKKFSDQEIYDTAQNYMNDSRKVAEILGCSVSTVNHSEGWRRRKENGIVFED